MALVTQAHKAGPGIVIELGGAGATVTSLVVARLPHAPLQPGCAPALQPLDYRFIETGQYFARLD